MSPRWRGANLKMGDEQCEVQAGGCNEGQNSEPMTEGISGPVVGYDSTRVIDDSTNDKNGILPHEGAHAAGQPGQSDGAGQCLRDDVTASQKAPNKANLESKQNLKSQLFKSETAGAEGRKQSQSSKEETRRKPRSRDDRAARQSSRRPVASEAEGSGPAPRSSEASGDAPGDRERGMGRDVAGRRQPAAQGSGPQVMVGVRNLMIDECFFSGKTSLAAGNHHGHVPPRESGGTRVNLNRRMKRALGRWSQDVSVASSAG